MQNLYAHEPYLKRKEGPSTSGHDGITKTGFTLQLDTIIFFCKKKGKIYETTVFGHQTMDRTDANDLCEKETLQGSLTITPVYCLE